MKRQKQKKVQIKLTIPNIITGLVSIIILLGVIFLPAYYKIIWPTNIGEPAKASTVDILAFWGAVFGGVITLVGVFLTVLFSKRQIQDTMHQQDKEQFIKGFGSTVLEINSISFEIKKFKNYLNQYKTNIEEYLHTGGEFKEIIVEFDTKNDYKKIGKEYKPDLEIICNRFEGKAAHADGLVYYHITLLTKDIKLFQKQLYDIVDNFNKINYEEALEIIYKEIHGSLETCEESIKKYKVKLGKDFIEYAEEDGLLESSKLMEK